MTLKELEYFVQVAESGSISKAAAVLAVAQPFLSKRIRQVEGELHEYLFHRNGRGIKLTEEGTLFLPYAKAALEQIDRGCQEFRNLKASPTGKITIGAVPDADATLSTLLGTFSDRFPRASLEVIEAKSWSVYEYLLAGRIDIAVLYDPPATPAIETIALAAQEVCLVSPLSKTFATAGSKINFAELQNIPLILPSHPHTFRALIDAAAARAGIKLNIRQPVTGAAFILELVQQGFGCTLLSNHIVDKNKFSNRLQVNKIVGPSLARTLTLATSSRRPPSRLARETSKLVYEIIKSGPSWPAGSTSVKSFSSASPHSEIIAPSSATLNLWSKPSDLRSI